MKSFWQNGGTLQFVSLVKFTSYVAVAIHYSPQTIIKANIYVRNKKAGLSQGEPSDAAVNNDTCQILQKKVDKSSR